MMFHHGIMVVMFGNGMINWNVTVTRAHVHVLFVASSEFVFSHEIIEIIPLQYVRFMFHHPWKVMIYHYDSTLWKSLPLGFTDLGIADVSIWPNTEPQSSSVLLRLIAPSREPGLTQDSWSHAHPLKSRVGCSQIPVAFARGGNKMHLPDSRSLVFCFFVDLFSVEILEWDSFCVYERGLSLSDMYDYSFGIHWLLVETFLTQ